jgi:hypothetical protein
MDDYNFMSEDEFVDCFNRGCEAVFKYNGKIYCINPYDSDTEDKISIMEVDNDDSEMFFNTPKEALEYLVDGKWLGDILLDMEVLDRSF